jgi:hypothetical protein
MANVHYRAGTSFERKVSEYLAEHEMAVVRAAGSKGAGKMDLVAFAPDGRVLIIQCKATGKISPGEWNRLVEVSRFGYWRWIDDLSTDPADWPVVPLVAMRSPTRAKPGAGWAPRLMRLADYKIPRSRTRPWKVYDVAHGRDIEDASDQG